MWHVLWQNFLAWRRGERRIAPRSMRGRVYERREPRAPGAAKTRLSGSISARVYRAATGKWENLGVISKPGKEN